MWELRHGPASVGTRSKYFDEGFFLWIDHKGGIEQIKNLAPPRLFETHSNATFFHRQLGGSSPCLKFIHIMRNPMRDVFRFYKKGQIRFSDILTMW